MVLQEYDDAAASESLATQAGAVTGPQTGSDQANPSVVSPRADSISEVESTTGIASETDLESTAETEATEMEPTPTAESPRPVPSEDSNGA